MRILFDFYVDEAVSDDYVNPIFTYTSGVDSSDTTEHSAREDDLPHLFRTSNFHTHIEAPERRNLAYQRFYKALVSQWVSIESLWKVRS